MLTCLVYEGQLGYIQTVAQIQCFSHMLILDQVEFKDGRSIYSKSNDTK